MKALANREWELYYPQLDEWPLSQLLLCGKKELAGQISMSVFHLTL